MRTIPSQCPICGGELAVIRLHCRDCDTSIEGRFATAGAFAALNAEQMRFVETFVRCEGKLSRLEQEFGLSYPTLRNRLHEIIRLMGYEPGDGETGVSDEERRQILEDLDAGKITYEEALQRLEGKEA